MSVHKVPQDVEADDKLVGPFSPRQFIYLVVVVMAIAVAYFLGKLYLPLAFLLSPIIILFGALALPLRKDQPMETYLAAIVSFFLKPRLRLWSPDGVDATIEIVTPKNIEYQLTKNISQYEAGQRISYLAKIVDSQGWAIRGTGSKTPDNSMDTNVYYSDQNVEDIMDENSDSARALTKKLEISDAKLHQEALDIVANNNRYQSNQQAQQRQSTYPTPNNPRTSDYFGNLVGQNYRQYPGEDATLTNHIEFNPYPEDIHQTVIRPISEQLYSQTNRPTTVNNAPSSTSEKPLTAAIINLANNKDLSIETIAREANRIHKRQDLSDEVFVSLR